MKGNGFLRRLSAYPEKRFQFEIERQVLPPFIEASQVNTVMKCELRNRLTGTLATVSSDAIDYSAVLPTPLNPKFMGKRDVSLEDPRVTTFVYVGSQSGQSGARQVCTGAPSSIEAIAGFHATACILNALRQPDCPEFVVANIEFVNTVFAGCFRGLCLKLPALKEWCGEQSYRAIYEPELFPAVRVNTGQVMASFFRSGCFLFTGRKTDHDICHELNILCREIFNHPGLCVPEGTEDTGVVDREEESRQYRREIDMYLEESVSYMARVGTDVY